MPDLSTIGGRLEYARSQKGLRQKDVAALLGVHPPELNRWEKGKHIPGADTLKRLAEILDCNVAWLISGDGEPPVNNIVSRGTSEPRSELTPSMAGRVEKFKREMRALGATERDIDQVHNALYFENQFSYRGDDGRLLPPAELDAELTHQITGQRRWVKRVLARRAATTEVSK